MSIILFLFLAGNARPAWAARGKPPRKKAGAERALPRGGAPEGARTPDLRFRKPPLYPAELLEHGFIMPQAEVGCQYGRTLSGKVARQHLAV